MTFTHELDSGRAVQVEASYEPGDIEIRDYQPASAGLAMLDRVTDVYGRDVLDLTEEELEELERVALQQFEGADHAQ